MMILQVILEGVGLGVLLILVCAIGIRKGAEDMGLEPSHDFENRINFRFLENTVSYETRLSDR